MAALPIGGGASLDVATTPGSSGVSEKSLCSYSVSSSGSGVSIPREIPKENSKEEEEGGKRERRRRRRRSLCPQGSVKQFQSQQRHPGPWQSANVVMSILP